MSAAPPVDERAPARDEAGAPVAPARWWDGFFDDLFADALLARDDAATAPTVDFLVAALGLGPGARVLDQGCGTGRLSLPLAARGLAVVGVELSARYVERARAEAARAGLTVELHAADATRFVPDRPCDAAFNWFTSFGFSDDDALNRALLERARDALRDGGRFALDYANVPGLFRRFQPTLHARHTIAIATGDERDPVEVELVRASRLDLARGMMEQRWTWRFPDGRELVRDGATRLYAPHDLVALLRRAGFRDVRLLGGIDGAPLSLDSPRCVAVATR